MRCRRLMLSALAFFAAQLAAVATRADEPASQPPKNPVLEQLIERGIRLGEGDATQMHKLPPPSMSDGLDLAEQKKLLKQIAGRIELSRFLADKLHAPHIVKAKAVKSPSGKRLATKVDLWFIAYGDLDLIVDKKLLGGLGEPAPNRNAKLPSVFQELTPQQLETRNIRAVERPDFHESYHFTAQPLLDRVQLSLVSHVVRTRAPQSLVIAEILDPRFAADAEFPNQWQAIRRDAAGDIVLGPAQPYEGYGAYAKVTPLAKPAGAMLVERHLVINEPYGWFDGRGLLSSKMTLATKDAVQKLRRALRKARDQDLAKAAKSNPPN